MATSSAGSECGSLDFEAELENFYIRKPNVNINKIDATSNKNHQKPFEFIPLMLWDVLRCAPTRKRYIYQIFDGSVHFRTFILHGRVVSHHADNAYFHRYEIDDGTAVAKMHIFKKTHDMRAVQLLQNEVDTLKRNSVKDSDRDKRTLDCLDCLRRLLNKTMQQLDASNLSVGSKLFVEGKPDYFRGDVNIQVNSWHIDAGVDRTMELAFKDILIDWYTNKYPNMQTQQLVD